MNGKKTTIEEEAKSATRKRVFSGIQPSGRIHIGNYLGAIRNWTRLLDPHDCVFCIVDYHAITIEYDVKEMPRRTLEAAAANIAAGLDPDRCTLFVQSHVPEHTELAWVLNCVAPMGELERMTQYKEKKQQHAQNVNAGLFSYPVLQTADILLYKAELVPVGEDQEQHLELAREIARRFNRRFGEVFPEPQTLVGEAARILGLDGKQKMSKSLDNYVGLTETSEEIWNRLRPAVTDENRKRRSDPGNPDICNIFSIHKHFTPEEKRKELDHGCRTAGIGCIDCKKVLHEEMMKELDPIRERYEEWISRPEKVEEVLRDGAAVCRRMARETLREVREAMGLLPATH